METWSTGMTKVGPMEVKENQDFFSPKALISLGIATEKKKTTGLGKRYQCIILLPLPQNSAEAPWY